MERRSKKITMEGCTLVLWPDECTREAVRVYRGPGGIAAVLQRNGNVGVSRTGLFEKPDQPRPQLRAAQCLYGLKLIGSEILQAYWNRLNASEHDVDLRRLQGDAEDLGYKLVKLPKPKLQHHSRKKLSTRVRRK